MTRTDRLALATFAAALLLAAAPAGAKDETCTDGTSCLCDKIAQTDPGVVFCEDFESPLLNQDGAGSGWTDAYGAPVDGWWQKGLASGQWVKTVEGTCATCCVNVVTETACEVPGQTDCVFQGKQSLGHRYHPGETQGIVGSKSFQAGANFGVTMAVKFSKNFANQDSPKKTDEFGPSSNCVMGCSSGTIVSPVSGNPYHGSFFTTSQITGATALRGLINSDASAFRWAARVPTDYDFDRNFGLDSWHCRQFHVSGVGKAGARIRDWIDGNLLVDVTNVDLTKIRDAAAGLNSITWNNYMNGAYQGSTIAYRYEDNVVVTTSSEPVSCEAIGFNLGGSTPPTQLGVPGQPKLIP